MSSMYESIKEVVHETLQRGKSAPPPGLTHLSESQPEIPAQESANLTDEIDDVEKFIAEKINRLKAAARQAEAQLTQESERFQETIATLQEKISRLERQVAEAEEKVQSRDHELAALQDNSGVLTKQVSELEANLARAKDEAAAETRRATQLMETSTQKLSGLENRVKELEDLARDKEAAARTLEQRLATVNQEFAAQLDEKEKLTAARDAELIDVKAQLDVFTRWVQEMPSLAKTGAPALPQQNGSSTVERTNGTEKRSLVREPKPQALPARSPYANQTVAPAFFDLMIRELTLIKGPSASAAVRDHVTGLGESIEQFPRSRLAELLEALSKDIINDDLKIAFRKWFVKHA